MSKRLPFTSLASALAGRRIEHTTTALAYLTEQLGRAVPDAYLRQSHRTIPCHTDIALRIQLDPQGMGDVVTGWAPVAAGQGVAGCAYRLMAHAPAEVVFALLYLGGERRKLGTVTLPRYATEQLVTARIPESKRGAWLTRTGRLRAVPNGVERINELVLVGPNHSVGIDAPDLNENSWRAAVEQLATMETQHRHEEVVS